MKELIWSITQLLEVFFFFFFLTCFLFVFLFFSVYGVFSLCMCEFLEECRPILSKCQNVKKKKKKEKEKEKENLGIYVSLSEYTQTFCEGPAEYFPRMKKTSDVRWIRITLKNKCYVIDTGQKIDWIERWMSRCWTDISVVT